jgi:ectoine hydroxylase-related dioxygenase (phytanoyl-CoA dioxygenase family)
MIEAHEPPPASLARFTVAAAEATARAQQIFRNEGILVVKHALPAAVCRATRDYLAAARDDMADLFARHGIAADAPDAGAQVARLLDEPAAVSPDDRHVLLGHFPLPVRLSQALWQVPLALAEQPLLYALLGVTKLYVHMPPTARFVLPGNAKAAVPAHQDVTYNKHLGPFCVVWVPLVEIDRACGGMAIYPRTQGRGELFSGDAIAPADGWIPGVEVTDLERVDLYPLAPGDIVIMGNETVHESMPNLSSRTRLSVDFRFFGDNSRSSKHYLDLAARRVVAPAA